MDAPAGAHGTILRVTSFGGPYGALEDIVAAVFEREGLGNVIYDTQ